VAAGNRDRTEERAGAVRESPVRQQRASHAGGLFLLRSAVRRRSEALQDVPARLQPHAVERRTRTQRLPCTRSLVRPTISNPRSPRYCK